MPSCSSRNFAGVRCARKVDIMPYFIYHDSMGRFTEIKYLCQDDSNRILGQLMEREMQQTRLIDTLRKKIDYLQTQIRSEKSTKNENRQKELRVLFEKIKRINEHRNNIRNKECRFCNHPLKDPEQEDDQLGKCFSHANFHSPVGYRRADILFHNNCGITWLSNMIYFEKKDMKYLQPKRTGQHTLFTV